MPGLVEWPTQIAKPFASELACSTLDICPTVLAATGTVAQNQIQPLDGINLLPLFERQMESPGKAIPFVAQISKPGAHAALLDWPYKLHTDPSSARGKKAAVAGEVEPVMLFDVSKDPKETVNLAAEQPDRVAKMSAELTAWKTSVLHSLIGADYGPPSDSNPPWTAAACCGFDLSSLLLTLAGWSGR